MIKQSIARLVLTGALAGVVGWVAVPHVASAANNPDGSFVVGFADLFRSAFKDPPSNKRVNFWARVNALGVQLDTVSPLTASTSFQQDALLKCTGVTGTFASETGASPLDASDDLTYFCPWWSDGEMMQWGVGITN